MLKLRCVVEHITYQNPENGWSVMKVNVKGYKAFATLTGSLLDMPVVGVLLMDGDRLVDPKYGQQFVAQSWEGVMPLQRNLIYKWITRAKKICVLVGTPTTLAYAIRNQTVSKRNTKLRERLNPNKHES